MSHTAVTPRRLILDYRLLDDVGLADEDPTRHVERWTVTVSGDDNTSVGYAHVIVLNLESDLEIADLTDAMSGAWIEPVVRSGVGGGAAGALGPHVLVLDRVFVEPAHRGRGLGPVVAALAIARLGRGCSIAVCFPAPFDGPHTDDDRDRSIVALGLIWETVGFRPRPDGVWVLDLDGDDLRSAIDRLFAARRRSLTRDEGPPDNR